MTSAVSFRPLRSLACWLGCLLMVAALAGCSTFKSRSREKAATFQALDAATQARLQAKEIHVGDTTDMVYIALGRADQISGRTDAAGQGETWIYFATWREYRGTAFVGYRRHVVRNPATGAVQVFVEPVSEPVYETRTEERLRITFDAGRVSAIEEPATAPAAPSALK